MSELSDPLIGYQFGSYVVEGFIGAGGMGRVYKGRHQLLGRPVALKVLPSQLGADAEYVQRFFREAKLTSTLHHPNLVEVYDFGDSDYGNYIALELVDGMSLAQVLKNEGRLNQTQLLQVAQQALSALEHAHAAGVIHRDIKPENMLVAQNGTLKITDLGLAKANLVEEDSALTISGTVMGTPHYMAPEQIRGDKTIDGRADLYALGATLFHCATGRPPFAGATLAVIMNKHLTDPTPNPKSIVPELSEEFARFIMRLMHKDPNYRYRGAREAGEVLQQMLGDGRPNQTVVILEETADDGNKRLYAIGTALIVLIFGIGFGIWKWETRFQSVNSKTSSPSAPPAVTEKPAAASISIAPPPTPPPPVSILPPKPPEPPSVPTQTPPAPPIRPAIPELSIVNIPWRDPTLTENVVFKGEHGQTVELISTDALELTREHNIFFRFPIKDIYQKLEKQFAQKPEIRRVDMILVGKIMTSSGKLSIKLYCLNQDLKETFSIAPSPPLVKPLPALPKDESMRLAFNITDDVQSILKKGENFGWALRLEGDGQVMIGSPQDPNEAIIPSLKFMIGVQENLIPAETRAQMTR